MITQILAMDGGAERNILASVETDSLKFEYEVDSNRERIVLGRGTYGIVRNFFKNCVKKFIHWAGIEPATSYLLLFGHFVHQFHVLSCVARSGPV